MFTNFPRTNTNSVIEPLGGHLVSCVMDSAERSDVLKKAIYLTSIQLSHRSVCDLELLATGAFSPLAGFMGKADYDSALDEMRLADGTLFPIPITLPIGTDSDVEIGQEISLRSAKYELLAIMRIDEIFQWDLSTEARQIYQTTDTRHPLVAEMHSWGKDTFLESSEYSIYRSTMILSI